MSVTAIVVTFSVFVCLLAFAAPLVFWVVALRKHAADGAKPELSYFLVLQSLLQKKEFRLYTGGMILVTLIVAGSVYGEMEYGGSQKCIVREDTALYDSESEAKTQTGDPIQVLSAGTRVTVVLQSNDSEANWDCHIRTAENKFGWVKCLQLDFLDPDPYPHSGK